MTAGALQRCSDALLTQTSGLSDATQAAIFSETSVCDVTFTQSNIAFTQGVDPHRVKYIYIYIYILDSSPHNWTYNPILGLIIPYLDLYIGCLCVCMVTGCM